MVGRPAFLAARLYRCLSAWIVVRVTSCSVNIGGWQLAVPSAEQPPLVTAIAQVRI